MIRGSFLKIDLETLTDNTLYLKSLSNNSFFCPMIKANAYGHGVEKVARALVDSDINTFGTALYEEAIEIRSFGIDKPDLLVFAALSKKAIAAVQYYRLTPVIVRFEDIASLGQASEIGSPIKLHLKVQTGMQRLGVAPADLEKALNEINKYPKLELQGLCTHLPNAEDLLDEDSSTEKHLHLFQQLCEFAPKLPYYHALNSEALIRLNDKKSKWRHQFGARPGIGIYGGIHAPGIKPAMSLVTRIVQIHNVEAGEGVSYGHQWRAKKKSTIGVLEVGYGDGVSRVLSGQLNAVISGAQVPCVGRICMDYIMVDLTDLGPESQSLMNQQVLLLDASVDSMNTTAWAKKLNTIPYEVMTNFSKRLPREYI